eukprot:scaffold34284_cov24-Tisochrysis_lutea.AAC.2
MSDLPPILDVAPGHHSPMFTPDLPPSLSSRPNKVVVVRCRTTRDSRTPAFGLHQSSYQSLQLPHNGLVHTDKHTIRGGKRSIGT